MVHHASSALLAVFLLPQTAQGVIQWGDPHCWSGWQVHELCCYPRRVNQAQLQVWNIGFASCWDGDRNASRCCKPHGSFFRISRSLPSSLQNLLEGCDALDWQSFLFKVRVAAGNLWALHTSVSAWFRNLDLPLGRRKTTGSCAAGFAIHRILLEYLFIGLSAESVQALNLLEFLDGELRPWGGLFQAFGMTLAQLQFIRSLQLVQNLRTGRPFHRKFRQQKYLSLRSAASRPTRPLAFDFGASGGLDTEFYLYSGLKVVAVDGNAKALQQLDSRLGHFAKRRNLTLIHAAAGASSAPETAEFRIDHHEPEVSELFDGKPLKDSEVQTVPRRACGALYSQFVRRIRPEYVKIDLEGLDLHCLVSLLRNSSNGFGRPVNGSRRFKPPAPKFLSFEMHLKHPLDVIVEKAVETAQKLRGLLRGRFCAAKLCRQHIYNIRYVEGRGVVSRIGLGSSGLFGDAAVDWRVGENWRPLEAVLAELPQAGMLAVLGMDWFDLHLRHC